MPSRKEFQDIVKDRAIIVDSFFYDGDNTYIEASKAIEINTERKA